ncbi:YfhJ family protein [Desertibacillus haloalkaliphilus]|uniref:YfhJ family protein n=1 Tax=Desertibacillus haloalkaliphilus TaxID=1328930 RepID=UPI001C26542F|nr:YfhJ family protein [Desertibacillus haloalkaliphilus]MBU8908871.1 YfhJ family protein [Desertibacillus haloalkaliphilus]
MNEQFDQLTKRLLEKNNQLSYEEARSWVEGMWEDFEATRAKAGREYRGKEMTEQIVLRWIENYGPHLHRYASQNKKFKHLKKDEES